MGNASSTVLPNSSSRCLTEAVTAVHDFEVTNYPLLDGMGVGKFVSSGVFSVGGHDWTVRFYPDGRSNDNGDNASAFLWYLGNEKDVRAKFSLNFLRKPSKEQETFHDDTTRIFSPGSHGSGHEKFVSKWSLKYSPKIKDGCFIIRCVLTVIKKSRTEEERCLAVAAPQPDLHLHLGHLLEGGEGADVAFSVQGQLFDAHRCVLAARSPVFRAAFFGPATKEKPPPPPSGLVVEIHGVAPPIFEALLHFVYTDSVPDGFKQGNVEKMQQLLVAADRYGMDRLKAICEGKLCEIIDVATVAATLVLAEQHRCASLRDACVEFITSGDALAAIMGTDGFKQLVACSPLLMERILQKVSRV